MDFREMIRKSSKEDTKIEVSRKRIDERVSPQEYLRNLGHKIKEETATKDRFRLKFYSNEKSKLAYEDLLDGGFRFEFLLDGNSIEF